MKVVEISMISGNTYRFNCTDVKVERIGAKITKIQLIGSTELKNIVYLDYNKIEAIFITEI